MRADRQVRDAAERTRLAWERSALGPLAAAALLLAKRLDAGLGVTLLAAVDVVLALVLVALGRRRSRLIREQARHGAIGTVPDATGEIVTAALVTTAVAVATAVLVAVVS